LYKFFNELLDFIINESTRFLRCKIEKYLNNNGIRLRKIKKVINNENIMLIYTKILM
jgi:hypothetical protein